MTGVPALVEEAARKAAVAWLSVDGRRAYPVWCLWHEGALYVVSGPGEQPAPGLDGAGTTTVSLRGDHGGRIVAWRASVSRVYPQTDDWAAVAPQLAGKRLNLPASADETVQRWADSAVISRLAPAGEVDEPTDASGAVPAPRTPANRRTAAPFKLHKVRRSPR